MPRPGIFRFRDNYKKEGIYLSGKSKKRFMDFYTNEEKELPIPGDVKWRGYKLSLKDKLRLYIKNISPIKRK